MGVEGEKYGAWIDEFRMLCELMRSKNERIRTLPIRGVIIWLPDYECKNCHRKGVFLGGELDYGEFYECAEAMYCPNCKSVFDVFVGVYFASFSQERFLPVMKMKLMLAADPEELPVYEDGKCPRCGGKTYTFEKNLGGVDYYINYWTVCINPNCDWPGMHREEFQCAP